MKAGRRRALGFAARSALCVAALGMWSACASSGPSAQGENVAAEVPGPPACGQAEADADFSGVKPGSLVELQPQQADDVEQNWSPDMSLYLGSSTSVIELLGVDGQGCPGVRVEADAGVFFWRVRDLKQLDGEHADEMRCGQSELAPDYLGFVPGSRVDVQEPLGWFGDYNWITEMDVYIGRTARVVQQLGVDGAGCPGVELDVDGGRYFWRVRGLAPASD